MALGLQDADLVVVGSGFYGLTVAERAACDGARVVVLERRRHLGGNAWSEPEPSTGIEVHTYGSHIFHTSNERVWAYVNRFGAFNDYVHHVWTVHRGRVYPMPIGLATMTQFFGRAPHPRAGPRAGRRAGRRARRRVARQPRGEGGQPRSAGRCTRRSSAATPPSSGRPTLASCPSGSSRGCRCASPTTRATSPTPTRASRSRATARCSRAWRSTPGVTVAHRRRLVRRPRRGARPATPVVYTGPVDRYFDFRAGALGWRTLDLETEVLDVDDHQGTTVMNYADEDVPHTRVHEFQHYHPERPPVPGRTVVMTECSRWAQPGDEPYYPVDTPEDRRRLAGVPRAHGRRARRPLRRPARQLPVPRHAHGDRVGAHRVRQRDRSAPGPRARAA